jgi:uncharacterized phage-associated protein
MGMNRPNPKNLLENVITFLCFQNTTLSQTKLIKLIYLADVYHMEKYGKRLTNVPFRHWYYGPYSEVIGEELEHLCGEGIINQKVYQTRSGYFAEIPTPNVKETTIELPNKALEVLKAVVEDFGNMNTDQIVKITKAGPPFADTPFGEEIDFERIDVAVEIAKKLGISIEKAATELVEKNKDLLESLSRAKEKAKV